MTARKVLSAVAVLLVLAGTSGCGVFGQLGFGHPPMRISAQFTDSVGLFVGNDVSVLGIKVGSVTGIRPSGTHVVVDMAIDPGVRIPADAGAATMSPSVVTDREVELTPVYRGGPTMRDGDLIPADRTHTPVEIDRVFAEADRLTSQLAAIQQGRPVLSDALGATVDALKGNGDKLRAGIQALSAVVGVGADQRDQLVELIKDVDHLSRTAADNDGQIRDFSGKLTDATALLDQQGPQLVTVLDNVNDLLDKADALIREHRDKGEATLDNVQVTANTLAGRTRELAEAADVLPTAFQNLANIVDPARGMARVHVGLDQALLDTQLLQGICQRFGVPALCAAQQAGRATDAGLGLLFLGGAR